MSAIATSAVGQQTPTPPPGAETQETYDGDRDNEPDEAEVAAEQLERAIQKRNTNIWRLCFTVFALVQAGNVVLQPPLAQLKELSSCMAYYGPGWSLGRDCRIDSVQNELETLLKWQQLLDSAPGILFGVFYGMAADRFGRRPVLGLALLGITVSAVWTQVVCKYNCYIFFNMMD